MKENEETLNKAAQILTEHRVGEIATAFLERGYRYKSTPAITFKPCRQISGIDEEISGVSISHERNEIAIVTTKFESSAAPDSLTSFANGIITYNDEIVLKVNVSKEYDNFGGNINFQTYAFSIKSMKAGPWLEKIGTYYDLLETNAKVSEEKEKSDKLRDQALNIDLGEYGRS